MNFRYRGQPVWASTNQVDRRVTELILGDTRRQSRHGTYPITLEEQNWTSGELTQRFLAGTAQKGKLVVVCWLCQTLARILWRRHAVRGYHATADCRVQESALCGGVGSGFCEPALATLNKAFNLALREWEWCQRNPALSVSMERESNGRDRWLTLDEEGRLLAACAPWLRDVVQFALGTGMRMGEILSLSWRGLDLTRRTVMVFQSKNGERRTNPLNQTVLSLIKERGTLRSLSTDLVFPSKTHTPLESGRLRRAFRLALKKVRIEEFHFHDLRHTFATRLVQAGVELYKVQRLLGHKSPMMTQRYAHHYPESLRDGVEMLDRLKPVAHFITVGSSGRGVEAVSC